MIGSQHRRHLRIMTNMATVALRAMPPDISLEMLVRVIDDTRHREQILVAIQSRFERQYACSLEDLESRLLRGEGREHPDWEDSIEWRNALEALQRARLTRSILEWLVRSNTPSRNS